jgi:hypothetical protein
LKPTLGILFQWNDQSLLASFVFGESKVTTNFIREYEAAGYFPAGDGRAPLDEQVPTPAPGEVVVFTDFFTCGLRFPCDPMLIAILDKFSVKIHHLSPNSFLELWKFFWIMKTFRCNFSADVFARLFELVIAGNYQTQRWPIPRIALQLLYSQHTPTKYATRAHTYLDCALL